MAHNNLWKILKEMVIPDDFAYLLRNLYAGQEATARIRHQTMDWFTIGKGVFQNWGRSMTKLYIVTCLFNLNSEYIMQNARLDESKVGIKLGISTTSDMQMILL